MTLLMNRRRFLRGTGLFGVGVATGGIATPYVARAATNQVRIVSNPGLENATLNAILDESGYFKKFGVNATVIQATGATGPFDAIVAGAADVCMVSGYNMVLSQIERGAPIKIVGAGMRKAALTVFAKPEGIQTLADLQGKTVAVGAPMALLHALMQQLMKEKGIDASRVKFVDKGSNDECYQAVVSGEVDACCSSISHLNDQDGLRVITEANLWEALPRYIFQTAYASEAALKTKRDLFVPLMAAYGKLYEDLMSPSTREVFFAARKRAQKNFDLSSAQATWDFNQTHRPYSRDLSLNASDVGYLQDMFLGLGSLRRKQPFAEVTDMWAAQRGAQLL